MFVVDTEGGSIVIPLDNFWISMKNALIFLFIYFPQTTNSTQTLAYCTYYYVREFRRLEMEVTYDLLPMNDLL